MRVWAVITFIQQVISTKAEGKVICQFARLHKSNDWSSPDKKFGWEHFEAKKFLCKKFFWVKHFLVKKYDWVENALIKNVWKTKKVKNTEVMSNNLFIFKSLSSMYCDKLKIWVLPLNFYQKVISDLYYQHGIQNKNIFQSLNTRM